MGDTSTETATTSDRRAGARPEITLPRPLWSLRRVAIVVGIPVLVLVAVLVVNLLDRREIATSTVPGPVDRVVVQVARGDVRLVPAASGTTDVSVETTSRWRFMRPTSQVDADGSVTRVSASCPRVVLVVGVCAVDFLIEVPEGVQVFVRTDSGAVEAEGLDGWARFITSGGVTATDMRGAELLVESRGGGVDVGFAHAPSRVDISAGGGAVAVSVPASENYDVRTAGSTGEVDVTLDDVNDAERIIRIRGGDVTVRPR